MTSVKRLIKLEKNLRNEVVLSHGRQENDRVELSAQLFLNGSNFLNTYFWKLSCFHSFFLSEDDEYRLDF